MAFSVTCPKCRAILKSAAAIPAGKKVKCPKCGDDFAAPPLEDATAVAAAPVAARVAAKRTSAAEADASPADDDEPRSNQRRDDDEDDEPRSKKRARDDEDDEPRQARKPKRKKGGMGIAMLIGSLLVGGVVLVVACAGCGGLGYWVYYLSTKSPIVGTWEQVRHPLGIKAVNTFERDGHGSTKLGNVLITYKYRFEGNQLTIEPDQGMAGILKGINLVERYTVTFNGNEMTLTSLDNRPFAPPQQHYRRIN